MQQESMSLVEFQRKFVSDQACMEHLFKLRWPDGYSCPRCGHRRCCFHSTRLLFQCSACKYQVSVTAGTIFHKTRTPLVKWFWMTFTMARQKSGVSMLSLQRMLGIKSYKTVCEVLMKFSDLFKPFSIGKTVSDTTIKDIEEALGGLFVGDMVLDCKKQSREKGITTSSYSKSNKNYAACEFWGGTRKPNTNDLKNYRHTRQTPSLISLIISRGSFYFT